jgi:hypothetical protein
MRQKDKKERAGAAATMQAKVTPDVAIARQATGAEGFYGSGGYWRKRATEPVPTTRGDRHRQGRQRAAQQVNEKAMQRIEQSREEGNKRLNVGNLKKARKLGRKWGVKRSERKVKCPLHRDGCGKAAQGNKMVNHIISAHGATLENEGMAAYVAGMVDGLRLKNKMQCIAAVAEAARAATRAATCAAGAAQRANESVFQVRVAALEEKVSLLQRSAAESGEFQVEAGSSALRRELAAVAAACAEGQADGGGGGAAEAGGGGGAGGDGGATSAGGGDRGGVSDTAAAAEEGGDSGSGSGCGCGSDSGSDSDSDSGSDSGSGSDSDSDSGGGSGSGSDSDSDSVSGSGSGGGPGDGSGRGRQAVARGSSGRGSRGGGKGHRGARGNGGGGGGGSRSGTGCHSPAPCGSE